MTLPAARALLPAGFADLLPPDAAVEAGVIGRLMDRFAAQGYRRVKPPLIEFEDTLLAGPGAAMATHSFRLMDPVSRRMMALRADMTLQVARIAASRLAAAPRPLRLSYAGQVLRVKASELRSERQSGQAGVELIGSDAPAGDAEVVLLAADALAHAGVPALSVDLTMPTLAPAVAAGLGLSAEAAAALIAALDRKDAAAVKGLAGRHGKLFAGLLAAAGPAPAALERLARLKLPAAAAVERARLAEVAALVMAGAPELTLTIDPVENRGFEYHSGVSFTFFARRVRGELGRGGRYLSAKGEPSTGFTLYLDSLLRALPRPATERRLFLPAGTPRATAARLRAEGWLTVAGLDRVANPLAEARRQDCGHALVKGAVTSVVKRTKA